MSQRSNDRSISDAGASALGFALRSNTTLKKVGSAAWIRRVVLDDKGFCFLCFVFYVFVF